MRKMIKISIAVFCAGVLLSGIGTGVAIAEYTSLEYTGLHNLGEENRKEEILDEVVTPVEGKKIIVYEHSRTTDVVYDESVPMNTIRYKVSYNPDMVKVRVRSEEIRYDDLEPEEERKFLGTVRLSPSYFGSEFDLLMKNKDKILSELKQGKIGSYEYKDIDNVEIWMNPQMKEFVKLDW